LGSGWRFACSLRLPPGGSARGVRMPASERRRLAGRPPSFVVIECLDEIGSPDHLAPCNEVKAGAQLVRQGCVLGEPARRSRGDGAPSRKDRPLEWWPLATAANLESVLRENE
jgi:hypothetical protein